MKKVLFAILAFTFIFGVKAMSSASSDSHQLILVKSTSGSVGNPRTLVPIVASVDDETYMLEATFLTDIGMVDVLIQEQSSGASTYWCVDYADEVPRSPFLQQAVTSSSPLPPKMEMSTKGHLFSNPFLPPVPMSRGQ